MEVDFLARYPDGREELIQVYADSESPATRDREIRALLDAAREHPRAALRVVTLQPDTARHLPSHVTVQAAAAWLLAEPPPRP